MSTRRTERFAGALALASAAVHGGLAPEHFETWWGYGLFFAAATTALAILGLALLLDPFAGDRAWKRITFAAGAFGTSFLLALYAYSRTFGVPFAGPEAGLREAIGPVDVVTKIAEALLVILLAWLWLSHRDAAGAKENA